MCNRWKRNWEEEEGKSHSFFFMWMDKTIDGELNRTCLKADPIFLWSNACFSCIDGVAGIMPIITCPSCNLTNTRFCHKTGFVAYIWVCLVQTYTQTFRIWLRFCADIWTKNRRMAALLPMINLPIKFHYPTRWWTNWAQWPNLWDCEFHLRLPKA